MQTVLVCMHVRVQPCQYNEMQMDGLCYDALLANKKNNGKCLIVTGPVMLLGLGHPVVPLYAAYCSCVVQ